ncbi:isocitrate lyase/PEP mutase family protein [Desertibacillus haloalkaliphilus]|uniref:isocitrate lyase/PEP mutase family protein n=1 Tax=Desertibacillus haloalkaliphilus TaxID=1328930 RepID=UPI001C26FDEF|nr:isocitrate lyase/PEP mutase family protein [Desertibacillus haloalkaliphilus]MBU8906001.1 isocitrate lyase/PEP mutase family protein [Desertibacillus haloalkaliphilus]
MNRNQVFHQLLHSGDDILVAPGAANAITARLIEEAGFPVTYITGAGLSNSMLGLADVGLLSFKEVLDQVKYICDAIEIPVIADGDTGFGNAVNTIRTVKEFEKAGVSAIQLEDQFTPKKCGHFEGKQIVPVSEMVNKIKAAVDARQDQHFKIIARTDARAIEGFDSAIERAEQFIEAGADITFVEAPQSVAEMQTIPERLGSTPQVANMVEHGKTPLVVNDELEKMGFKLVLYANFLQRRAIRAMQEALEGLKNENTTSAFMDEIISMKERNRLTRLDEIKKLEEQFMK